MMYKGCHSNYSVNKQNHNVQTHEQGGSAVLQWANKFWGLRSSYWCFIRFRSSAILHYVDWYIITDVLKYYSAFTFLTLKAKAVQSFERTSNYLPVDTAWLPRRPASTNKLWLRISLLFCQKSSCFFDLWMYQSCDKAACELTGICFAFTFIYIFTYCIVMKSLIRIWN
jgi:hypothetical protein